MKHVAAALVVIAGFATPAMAQDRLPKAGTCERNLEGTDFRAYSVSWAGTVAQVNSYGTDYRATVSGLRPHDEGFKLSIMFEDDLLGMSEMVIFQLNDEDRVAYRMAIVTYETLPNGDRVIGSVNGFTEVPCTITW